MSLEDIVKKIDEDARTEAESLLSLARAEADAIREKARAQAEELRSQLMQKAGQNAEEHARRVKTLAGLDQRKEVLAEKKRLIDEAFARAEEKIINLPPVEYLAFLKPLILQAVESGNEEIIPSSRHRGFFTEDFLKHLNQELGPRGKLRLSRETGDFPAGFILREGRKEANVTLKSLIASHRDALEPQIAKIFFGDSKHG